MTSRQRVRAALSHREPDRVPVSFGLNPTSIIESDTGGNAYSRLCEHLHIMDSEPPVVSDAFNIVGNVDTRIMDLLGSDLRGVFIADPPAKKLSEKEKFWEGFFGLKIRKTAIYDELVDPPGRDWNTHADIDGYRYWPDTSDPRLTQGTRQAAQEFDSEDRFAILASGWYFFVPFNVYAFLCGYEKWFVDMKTNEPLYFYLCDKLLDLAKDATGRFLENVGEYVDLIMIGDDLGSQGGLLLSKEDYRKYMKPYTRKLIEHIRNYSKAKIAIHSCGAVFDILHDLVEAGVQVLNPVQVLAAGMDLQRLKREFGNELTFWGGIDEQKLLPHGTPSQVREAVKKTIGILAPGGGYILGPTHNIQPDTPPENIVAMYEAAKDCGKY